MNDVVSGPANAGIRFAIGEGSLGLVLVAASAKGICAIVLGEDPDALRRYLQDSFPRAGLIEDQTALADMVDKVVAFTEAPGGSLDLPFDIGGTPSEQRIRQALREIPAGSMVSYGEIARRLGAPVTAQEVATACASNRLAVAIPCHRVIKANGSISGYRWGVRRKRLLQAREAVA